MYKQSNEKWKWQKFISQDDTIIVNCRQPLKSSRVTSSLPGRPTAQIKLWLLGSEQLERRRWCGRWVIAYFKSANHRLERKANMNTEQL